MVSSARHASLDRPAAILHHSAQSCGRRHAGACRDSLRPWNAADANWHRRVRIASARSDAGNCDRDRWNERWWLRTCRDGTCPDSTHGEWDPPRLHPELATLAIRAVFHKPGSPCRVESASSTFAPLRIWDAIVHDDPDRAMPFFFPVTAHEQVKAIYSPASDWRRRRHSPRTSETFTGSTNVSVTAQNQPSSCGSTCPTNARGGFRHGVE